MREVFRPGYAANLVSSWIPALHDVQTKLEAEHESLRWLRERGFRCVDSKSFPEISIFGFDYHDKSIAPPAPQRRQLSDRVTSMWPKQKISLGRIMIS